MKDHLQKAKSELIEALKHTDEQPRFIGKRLERIIWKLEVLQSLAKP